MVLSNLRRIGPQGWRGLTEPGCFHGNLRTRDNQWVGYLFSGKAEMFLMGFAIRDFHQTSFLVLDRLFFSCICILIYLFSAYNQGLLGDCFCWIMVPDLKTEEYNLALPSCTTRCFLWTVRDQQHILPA